MLVFFHKKIFTRITLIGLLCALAAPGHLLADGEKDKSAGPAKTAPAKPDAPAPGLTERERMLLDRVEQLEKRVAELEAKKTEGASSAASLGTGESTSAATAAPATNSTVVNVASPSLANLAKGADGVAPGKASSASPN